MEEQKYPNNCEKNSIFAKIIRMESSVANELAALRRMLEELAAQRDEARRSLKVSQEEVADLKRELERVRGELHSSKLDIEYLTLSHKLADSPQALAEARTTVKKLLAGVNKAIALLKADAGI